MNKKHISIFAALTFILCLMWSMTVFAAVDGDLDMVTVIPQRNCAGGFSGNDDIITFRYHVHGTAEIDGLRARVVADLSSDTNIGYPVGVIQLDTDKGIHAISISPDYTGSTFALKLEYQPRGSEEWIQLGDTFGPLKIKDPAGHQYGTPGGGQAATCTEDGWKDYITCKVCKKTFADDDAKTAIEDLDAWKAGDGKIGALGHNMGEWKTVTEPTETEKGLKERACKREGCSHTEQEAIDPVTPEDPEKDPDDDGTVTPEKKSKKKSNKKADGTAKKAGKKQTSGKATATKKAETGKSSSVETGDESNLMLWIALAVICCMAMGFVLCRKKEVE